jgi:hypothetical protein
MHIYLKIYEFAASAGALEGYVYSRKGPDMAALGVWVDNLAEAYAHLPAEALEECQSAIDQTLGRAIRSLTSVLGGDHALVSKLWAMVKGDIPESADDFDKKKWFQGRS